MIYNYTIRNRKETVLIMKRFSVILILIITCAAVLYGCTSGGESKMENSYEQITSAEAKEIMDTQDGYIILDVRTQEEFDEAHIDGAILIPDYEIADKAESVLKDKDQLILVYCRSGRRSKLAASELVKLGYTNVKEFGGIIDWPYETV
jgi:rhodanese-related sulfurtransferase